MVSVYKYSRRFVDPDLMLYQYIEITGVFYYYTPKYTMNSFLE